ncbi:MAG: dual specificity protein phosphatase family protein [Burkholderiales bacterium]|nr:dual specificity protein phosphatase family protein [Burkholderiales bacterium]
MDFISKSDAQQMAASDKIAVISVTGPLGIPPTLNGFYRVLPLEFEDTPQANAIWAFNRTHATAIINFVGELHRDSKLIDLIVHCRAGISRSAAIATYVAEKTDCEFPRREWAGGANRLILQLLKNTEAGVG